jgi:hypothetical protein
LNRTAPHEEADEEAVVKGGKDESLRGAEVLSGGVVLDEHGLDAVALHLEYGDAAAGYL